MGADLTAPHPAFEGLDPEGLRDLAYAAFNEAARLEAEAGITTGPGRDAGQSYFDDLDQTIRRDPVLLSIRNYLTHGNDHDTAFLRDLLLRFRHDEPTRGKMSDGRWHFGIPAGEDEIYLRDVMGKLTMGVIRAWRRVPRS